MSGGTAVALEIGIEGGLLLLITRTPSLMEILTGSHFVLSKLRTNVLVVISNPGIPIRPHVQWWIQNLLKEGSQPHVQKFDHAHK